MSPPDAGEHPKQSDQPGVVTEARLIKPARDGLLLLLRLSAGPGWALISRADIFDLQHGQMSSGLMEWPQG